MRTSPTFIVAQSNGFPPAPAERGKADRMSKWLLSGGPKKPTYDMGVFLRSLDSLREADIARRQRISERRYRTKLLLNTCPSCDRTGCRSHADLVSWLDFKGWYLRQPRQLSMWEAA